MRPSTENYFLDMATLVSTRATCPRRQVGCVTVDKHKHVLSTGYNGVYRGAPHCINDSCGGEDGTLDQCRATHGEMNALLQCKDVMEIDKIYCTTSPCITCAKLIANTGCKVMIYREQYKDTAGIDLLNSAGITTIYAP